MFPMSCLTALSETADHAAWAQAARKEQVEVLGELARAGSRLALAIETRAVAEPDAAPAEAAMAFARVARAVRMTCLLQSRLLDEMERAKGRQDVEHQRAAERAREDVKDRVHAIVSRVA
jgi:hypothetical protein